MSSELSGGLAVVTGAAGEIGRGMARAFSREDMTVVLSDVDESALADAEHEIRSSGGRAATLAADVSDPEQVERLCAAIVQAHGVPRVVCANAGVMGPFAELWTQHPNDWTWVFRVNVFGVLGMIRGLVPAMIASGEQSHFVITGSDATYAARPYVATYHATKHALGAIAEGLHLELAMTAAPVAVHLVCPTGVRSPRLLAPDRERLRPADLRVDDTSPHLLGDRLLNAYRSYQDKQTGDDVAAAVIEGIRRDLFYIWPDPRVVDMIKDAYDGTLDGRAPRLPEHFMNIFAGTVPAQNPTLTSQRSE